MFRGANVHPPPAPGPLLVLSAKSEGVTPGLVVEDHRGQRWFAKFDPPANPNLVSAAEVISSRLLYAAGYHVPEYWITTFRRKDFVLKQRATTKDRYGRKVPLTRRALDQLLAGLNPTAGGELRAVFSRMLDGEPIGPSPQTGVRPDDPNDQIPHQHRRSLRGLWVFSAWINNTDTKTENSLHMFLRLPKGGGSWLREAPPPRLRFHAGRVRGRAKGLA